MSDEEICEMLGWPRRAAALLADYPDGLLGRICAVVREAKLREREACATVCDDLLTNPHTGGGWSDAMVEAAVAIRARGNE